MSFDFIYVINHKLTCQCRWSSCKVGGRYVCPQHRCKACFKQFIPYCLQGNAMGLVHQNALYNSFFQWVSDTTNLQCSTYSLGATTKFLTLNIWMGWQNGEKWDSCYKVYSLMHSTVGSWDVVLENVEYWILYREL